MFNYRTNKARLQDYLTVYNSVEGQRVLQDMMQQHHVLESSFNEGNSRVTDFNEGERNVVLRIMTMISYSPDDFIENVAQKSEED